MKAPATGGASLRDWVDTVRARLAELEAGFTIEKAKVEAMKARLFEEIEELTGEAVRVNRAKAANFPQPPAHATSSRYAAAGEKTAVKKDGER